MPHQCPSNDEGRLSTSVVFLRHWRGIGGAFVIPRPVGHSSFVKCPGCTHWEPNKMADIRAFRGFRYDLGRVGALSAVVAPPYDVIDAQLQEKLYGASEYNAIKLELTRDEPTDDESNNKYTRAANTLREWIAANVLRQDTARGLYVYEQEYTVEGATYARRGFLARV